jgi:mitochondrial import inner membrane translocase subunit TIM23
MQKEEGRLEKLPGHVQFQLQYLVPRKIQRQTCSCDISLASIHQTLPSPTAVFHPSCIAVCSTVDLACLLTVSSLVLDAMLGPTSTRLGLRLAAQRPISNSTLTTLPLSRRCLLQPPYQITSKTLTTRHASTTASHAPINSQPTSTNTTPPALDWNTFFRLRTTRRYYSLTSSLLGLTSTATLTAIFLTMYPDQSDTLIKLIPMDPIISTGITMTISMLAGWLIGPIFGNGLWRLLYRRRVPEFTAKERAFFERIKRHRVNPSGASTNNPVPDFYGEKIGSVQGYRRWLKDQRVFNRKRMGVY